MIASLEASVRALDEQKKGLELVISALKQEEAEAAGVRAEGVTASDADMMDAGNDAAASDAALSEDADGDTEELEVTDSSASD
jgi:peptidoglycan hydrolase CwlO-like protein